MDEGTKRDFIEDLMLENQNLKQELMIWRNTCIRMAEMILPFSLLMNKREQQELQIILQKAVRGE